MLRLTTRRSPFLASCCALVLSAICCAGAQTPLAGSPGIFPLQDVRAGMTGVGKTVFAGTQIQEFQVKILGVVHNMGPKQAVILARLSGGPLAQTGVLEGMSGSPVYIDGKLVGAVALGFPYAKTAIAGITPIQQMLAQEARGEAQARAQSAAVTAPEGPLRLTAAGGELRLLHPERLARQSLHFAPAGLMADNGELPELQTPLVLSGFSAHAIHQFLPQFRALGLVPMLGGTAGAGAAAAGFAPPSSLKPGDMISVQLVRGDLEVAADGTVTYIHHGHIFAFGHRFLSAGATAMPFSQARVVALMPGLMTSFKIAVSGRPLGVIRQDDSQGVYGVFGGHARMIPVRVTVHQGGGARTYRFEMVNNRFLTPFLFNLALASTLDATQRTVGPTTISLDGAIQLAQAAPVRIHDLFSGEINAPAAAAMSAAAPLSYLYQSGLPNLAISGIRLSVRSSDQSRKLRLIGLWSNRSQVAPGGTLIVTARLRTDNGAVVTKQIPVSIPATVEPGPLKICAGSGEVLDLMELQRLQQGFQAHSVPQLVRAINHLRRNDRLYLRVTQAQRAFVVAGEQLPAPPPSVARALAGGPAVSSGVAAVYGSPVYEYTSGDLAYVVAGVKSITVQVKATGY